MEKIWNKLKQGLSDYCQKNGFHQVILGLSGGLDSAVTAVLAADVLGGKNVKAIMMKTRYTSDLSLEIARKIAKLNHLDFQELDIEPLIQTQTSFLEQAFDDNVKGLTLENLQARIRGQILMAYSNQICKPEFAGKFLWLILIKTAAWFWRAVINPKHSPVTAHFMAILVVV